MDNSVINDLKNIGILFGAVGGPLGLGLLVAWRTRSFLTIFSRLWSLFHGKTTSTVPSIKEYLDSQSAVMHLIFSTGAKARTEKHATRLIDWCRKHDESLEDAVRCGPYFDWELPGLDETRKRKPGASIAALLLFLAFAGTLLAVSAYDKPILRMKATSTWFVITADHAEPLFSDQRLAFEQCGKPSGGDAPQHEFSAQDVALLCGIFGHEKIEERRAYFVKTLREQRIIAGLYGFVSLMLMIIPARTLAQQDRTRKMQDRLRKNATSRTTGNTQEDSVDVN